MVLMMMYEAVLIKKEASSEKKKVLHQKFMVSLQAPSNGSKTLTFSHAPSLHLDR